MEGLSQEEENRPVKDPPRVQHIKSKRGGKTAAQTRGRLESSPDLEVLDSGNHVTRGLMRPVNRKAMADKPNPMLEDESSEQRSAMRGRFRSDNTGTSGAQDRSDKELKRKAERHRPTVGFILEDDTPIEAAPQKKRQKVGAHSAPDVLPSKKVKTTLNHVEPSSFNAKAGPSKPKPPTSKPKTNASPFLQSKPKDTTVKTKPAQAKNGNFVDCTPRTYIPPKPINSTRQRPGSLILDEREAVETSGDDPMGIFSDDDDDKDMKQREPGREQRKALDPVAKGRKEAKLADGWKEGAGSFVSPDEVADLTGSDRDQDEDDEMGLPQPLKRKNRLPSLSESVSPLSPVVRPTELNNRPTRKPPILASKAPKSHPSSKTHSSFQSSIPPLPKPSSYRTLKKHSTISVDDEEEENMQEIITLTPSRRLCHKPGVEVEARSGAKQRSGPAVDSEDSESDDSGTEDMDVDEEQPPAMKPSMPKAPAPHIESVGRPKPKPRRPHKKIPNSPVASEPISAPARPQARPRVRAPPKEASKSPPSSPLPRGESMHATQALRREVDAFHLATGLLSTQAKRLLGGSSQDNEEELEREAKAWLKDIGEDDEDGVEVLGDDMDLNSDVGSGGDVRAGKPGPCLTGLAAERYCRRYKAKDRCGYCLEPLPKTRTAALDDMLSKLEAREKATGKQPHWTRSIAACDRHRAETTTWPLGLQAGYPQTLELDELEARLLDPECVKRVRKIATLAKRSAYFMKIRSDIDDMGKTRWMKKEHQQSDGVVEMLRAGYYGEVGRDCIETYLNAIFPDDSTLKPGDTFPLSPSEYIHHVLVIEVVIKLIREDIDSGSTSAEARAEAIGVLNESKEYGRTRFNLESTWLSSRSTRGSWGARAREELVRQRPRTPRSTRKPASAILPDTTENNADEPICLDGQADEGAAVSSDPYSDFWGGLDAEALLDLEDASLQGQMRQIAALGRAPPITATAKSILEEQNRSGSAGPSQPQVVPQGGRAGSSGYLSKPPHNGPICLAGKNGNPRRLGMTGAHAIPGRKR